MITWIEPVEIVNTVYSSWVDIDASAYVSAGATGVILRVAGGIDGADRSAGIRKNGSSDNRFGIVTGVDVGLAIFGVDDNKIFEIYETAETPKMYIVGFAEDEAVFFTNGIDKTPASKGSWQDIDISSSVSTDAGNIAGAIIELRRTSSFTYEILNTRANGSTDNRISANARASWQKTNLVKVDTNNIFECYSQSTGSLIFLTGYFLNGANINFNVNAVDVSLAGINSYTDIPIGAEASGVFMERNTIATSLYIGDIRKNGATMAVTDKVARFSQVGVECDALGVVEGTISNLAMDFFLIAITTKTSTFTPKIMMIE